MTEFKKATLQAVTQDPADPPKTDGEPIEVQINPATLRLQASASVDARKDAGRQRSQYQGTTSTLSFDLVFDTTDEGTTEDPVDVRLRTAAVERFVWPAKKGDRPPRVKFTYGSLSVVGVMKSLSTDLDLFSGTGVPLRAKCAVQIEEQKPAFDLKQQGAGSRTGVGATDPLRPSTPAAAAASAAGGAPGGPPAPTDRTGTALGGESASAFANRMGLDPRAWKALQGITDPMNLPAGLEIDFDSTLSLDTGLGVTLGATSTGRPPSGAGPADSGDGAAPRSLGLDQLDLTTAGGLTRALADATTARSIAAVASTTGAFVSGPSTAPPATTARPPASDPRVEGFGFGIPLRPRRGTATVTTHGLVHARNRNVWVGGDQPPETRSPSVPSWLGLAPEPSGGGAGCSCGCGGRTAAGTPDHATSSPCGCGAAT